jgi:hypothetical protein
LKIQVAHTELQGIFERYPLKQLLNWEGICTKQNRERRKVGLEIQQKRNSTHSQTALWVVSFFSQQRVKKRLAGRFLAAAMRFNRDEDGIDFGEMLGILEAKDPAAV